MLRVLRDLYEKAHRENRIIEEDIYQCARRKYESSYPQFTQWDFLGLVHFQLDNLFWDGEDLENYVNRIIPKMTPEMLAQLRKDPDGFHDQYAQMYYKREGIFKSD